MSTQPTILPDQRGDPPAEPRCKGIDCNNPVVLAGGRWPTSYGYCSEDCLHDTLEHYDAKADQRGEGNP